MRQFSCIELSQRDAMVLRDLMRPLVRIELFEQATLVHLCEKLYAAILKSRMDAEAPAVNVRIDEREAVVINHFVGSEDWDGALPLLEQTWLVLYELRHDATYPRVREPIAASVERLSSGLQPQPGAEVA